MPYGFIIPSYGESAAVNGDDSQEVLKETNVICAENNKSNSDDDFEGPATKRKLRAYSINFEHILYKETIINFILYVQYIWQKNR